MEFPAILFRGVVSGLLVSMLGNVCPPSASADPIRWSTSVGGNGHFYEAVSVVGSCTWDQALAAAYGATWESEQGHLATISSASENVWIWETLGNPIQYRLGGYQLPGSAEPAGGWTWISEEAWDYENWYGANPNNGGSYGNEWTIHFGGGSTSGGWNDVASVVPCPGYVVEFDTVEVPVSDSTWGAIKALFLAGE